jgi:hypothetical protein
VQVRLPERASGQSVPLADAPGIWTTSRHMRFLRVALAAVLLGLLVSLLVSSLRLKTRPTSYFAKGGGGLAVIDFSKSIDPRSYRRMSMILRTLADSNQRLGLIAFSDDAYMMLPPERAATRCGRCCASSAGSRSRRSPRSRHRGRPHS